MMEFGYIGWCNEDNHDKIWGYIYRPTAQLPSRWSLNTKQRGWNCCVFWGARGKALQIKADITGYELDKLVNSKSKKGYHQITEKNLLQSWPTFTEELEGKLLTAVLSGKVK